MKELRQILTIMIALFLINGCTESEKKDNKMDKNYKTFKNDPTNLRLYTLDNGLKVYLSVNKDKPRIQTYIAVKAGSKFDPSNATGLAHYLEHLMFKGTKNYGTLNYEKEKPLLEKIDSLFDVYRTIKKSSERLHIYHLIDSISQKASHYSIANEYDKMTENMGAKGTNAFTSNERTVYINDIPSNQIKKWIDLESERFSDPVFRLFHTELEAVYEEKNRTLDDDGRKVFSSMMKMLFPRYPYGTQTTIGTIHDLKNPSLTDIKKYFHNYYVPNNMAISLSGDFDPDTAIKYIKQHFGKLKSGDVPSFDKKGSVTIDSQKDTTVIGPDPAELMIGFRAEGLGTKDADMLNMIGDILNNGTAGLIDLDLNQKQKVLEAWAGAYELNDYSVFLLGGNPAKGQSLKEMKELLLKELDKVKEGDFPDWLPTAIVNNMKISRIKELHSNRSRAMAYVNTFTANQNWEEYLDRIDRISQFTKEDIVAFAKKHFKDNYAVVYKEEGVDTTVQKITKPKITPIELNKDSQSVFLGNFVNKKIPEIEPQFVDYEKEIDISALHNDIPLWYKKNEKNELFHLYYYFDFGTNDDKKINIATKYLELLGTDKYTPEEIQEQFYKLGCSFGVHTSKENTYVTLSGLQKNFDEGVQLFEHLLAKAQPDSVALKGLISNIQQSRVDAKKDKQTILFRAMRDFAEYGKDNPFTYRLNTDELNQLNAEKLTGIIHHLTSIEHKVMYYGPAAKDDITSELNNWHKSSEELETVPNNKFKRKDFGSNNVFVCDYDMKQTEIVVLEKGAEYNPELVPIATMYNEYFGGSMSSIIFQELRESKALAYSTFSRYIFAADKDDPNYNFSYIGCQSDKLPEALKGLVSLLDSLPESSSSFKRSKKSIIQKLRSKRISGTGLFFSYINAQKRGLDYDMDKNIFNDVPEFTFNDILKFQEDHVKDQNKAILVIGNKKNIDFNVLKEYGKVHQLSLKEVFGY